jgi:3-oxoacyl-[acyl-carrier protein] reductase
MNVLITGASKGVGLSITKVLLEQEYTVYAVSRTKTKEFSDLLKQYRERLFFKNVDLSNSDEIHRIVFKEFIGNEVTIHGFINNAAMAYDDIVTNLNLERLKEMYVVNVFSPMILTKYTIRNMLLHRIKGVIVHISSISAHTGYKGLAMYASSKGALEAFSKNTAREWGEFGIRSNVVVPGFMETAMSSTLDNDKKDRIYKRTSLKKPTDILSVAETVAFLLSEKACSITGQNLYVDNGTI